MKKEMRAVVGYMPDSVAKALADGGQRSEPIEIRMDRGNDELLVRINPNDVVGILWGASLKGETGVQVFLKDRAIVDTISRGTAGDLHMRAIRDTAFFKLRPTINVIYVNPQMVNKLTRLNHS